MTIELSGDVVVVPPPLPEFRVTPSSISSVTVVPVAGPRGPAGPAGDGGQVTLTGTAGEILSGHRVVTRDAADGIVYASNDDSAFLSAPLWLTTGAALVGAEVTVLVLGTFEEPTWSWTPGGPLYLGANGQLTQTPPTAAGGAVFLAQVGVATSATTVFIDRQPSFVLI